MTLLDPTDTLYAFVPFTSKGYDDSGVYHVRGLATDSSLDLDGQRCDPAWLKTAMPEWAEWGNIREMHGSNAVGVKTNMETKGSGWIVDAEVVDPLAATKCDKKVYKGFSIGIKNYGLDKSASALELAPNGIINKGEIIEISLVDRPANPNAKLELVKSATGLMTKGVPAPVAAEVVGVGVPCITCGGFGQVKNEGGVTEDMHECPECGGSGEAADTDNSGVDIRPSNAGGDQDEGEVQDDLTDDYKMSDADLAKVASSLEGNPELLEKIVKALTKAKCETCDGTGKIKDGTTDCPDCDGSGDASKAALSSAQMNDLPDSDFAYIERGGTKDDSGKTVPRSKRHFPINDAAHVRNALARAPQSPFGDKAMPKIKEAAKKFGIEVSDDKAAKMSKAIQGELTKLVANNTEWMHDPALLNTVLEGLATFISQEAEELANGSDELWDLQCLVGIAGGFTDWWAHEAWGGETPAPFTQGDSAMSFVGFGVSADLEKAATSDEATDEDRDAYKQAVRTALGIDEEIALEKTAREELGKQVVDLTAELGRVKTMAAPRGIALRATQEQKAKAAVRETILAEAKSLRDSASIYSDPSTRAEFIQKAVELEEQATHIQETE